MDAIIAAAALSFGFVYVHPFADVRLSRPGYHGYQELAHPRMSDTVLMTRAPVNSYAEGGHRDRELARLQPMPCRKGARHA